jgi:hypothetical protein
MLWVVQSAVPWTRRGVFSSSSMLDGARLVRSGAVGEVVPVWVAGIFLVVPAVGVLVAATAGLDGRAVRVSRFVALLVVAVLFLGFVHNVASADPGRLGPGGWLTVAGIVLGGIGLASIRRADRASRRGERPG